MEFHVLLVEDDRVTLKTVEQLLRNLKYKVTCAANGREAIKVLTSCRQSGVKVDLILTDILMPEVTGFDLIHEVVHGDTFCDVPVVVMSSQDSQESVLQAFQAGAADYLIKPIRKNELTTLWQHVWRANKAKGSGSATGAHVNREGGNTEPGTAAGKSPHVKDSSGGSSDAAVSVLKSTGGTTLPSHAATTRIHHPQQPHSSSQDGPGDRSHAATANKASNGVSDANRQLSSHAGGHAPHLHSQPQHCSHADLNGSAGLQESSVQGRLGSLTSGPTAGDHALGAGAVNAGGSGGRRPFAFNTSVAVHFDLKPPPTGGAATTATGREPSSTHHHHSHHQQQPTRHDRGGAGAGPPGMATAEGSGALLHGAGTSATVISWSVDALEAAEDGSQGEEHPDSTDDVMEDEGEGEEEEEGGEAEMEAEGAARPGQVPALGQAANDSQRRRQASPRTDTAAGDPLDVNEPEPEELKRQRQHPRKRPRLHQELLPGDGGDSSQPEAANVAAAAAGHLHEHQPLLLRDQHATSRHGPKPQAQDVGSGSGLVSAPLGAAAGVERSQGSRAASASASGGADVLRDSSGTGGNEVGGDRSGVRSGVRSGSRSSGGDMYAESASAYTSGTTTTAAAAASASATTAGTTPSTTGSGSETDEQHQHLQPHAHSHLRQLPHPGPGRTDQPHPARHGQRQSLVIIQDYQQLHSQEQQQPHPNHQSWDAAGTSPSAAAATTAHPEPFQQQGDNQGLSHHGLPHPAAAAPGSSAASGLATLPPGLQELATLGALRHEELWTQRARMHQRMLQQQQQQAQDATGSGVGGEAAVDAAGPGLEGVPLSPTAPGAAAAGRGAESGDARDAAAKSATTAATAAADGLERSEDVSGRAPGRRGSPLSALAAAAGLAAGPSSSNEASQATPSQQQQRPHGSSSSSLRQSDRSAFTAFTVFLPSRVAAASTPAAAAASTSGRSSEGTASAPAGAPAAAAVPPRQLPPPLFTGTGTSGCGASSALPAQQCSARPLPSSGVSGAQPPPPHILPPVLPLHINSVPAPGLSSITKPGDAQLVAGPQPAAPTGAAAAALNGSLGPAAAAAAAAAAAVAAAATHMPYTGLPSRPLTYGPQAPQHALHPHPHHPTQPTVYIPESVLQLIAHLSGRPAAEIPVPESVTAAPPVVVAAAKAPSAARLAAVAKYLEKRKHRNFQKKVRYESRKRLAEARPRVRGQFVKATSVAPVAAAAAAAAGSGAAAVASPVNTAGRVHATAAPQSVAASALGPSVRGRVAEADVDMVGRQGADHEDGMDESDDSAAED